VQHIFAADTPLMAIFFRTTWVSLHQNVSIVASIVAKDTGGGGDKWSYKTCKVQVE